MDCRHGGPDKDKPQATYLLPAMDCPDNDKPWGAAYLLAAMDGPGGPDNEPGPLELVDDDGAARVVHHARAHVDPCRQPHLGKSSRYQLFKIKINL